MLQIVGTATREKVPKVPILSVNLAKHPRKETLAKTLANISHSIVDAFKTNSNSCKQTTSDTEQVISKTGPLGI